MPERPESRFSHSFKPGLLISLLITLSCFPGLTQEPEEDTLILNADEAVVVEDTLMRDPQKAALYSAVLPGLGQIYNRKYWKLPIVYGGFATFGYFINRNSRYYKDLKQKLIDPEYQLKYFDGDFTTDQLTRGKDTYKRWRDLSIIGTAGFYVLQIIDATVDAYLFDWDVGEDISLHIHPDSPAINPLLPFSSFGFTACLSF